MKFKIGDTVERCIFSHTNMQVGDTSIITSCKKYLSTEFYKIKGYNKYLNGYFLKLVKPVKINWRERLSK